MTENRLQRRSKSATTRARDARFSARRCAAAAVRHRRRAPRLRALWLRAARDPALENIETLTGKYGEEGNKLIYKVLRRGEGESSGETDLALRYDLTVPLARVVADNRGKLPKFFKRYQIQPVWRADRPARGRFREFYQCDVDAIGSTSPVVEAEMIAAVSEVLQTLGFTDFVVQLNHRELLTALLNAAPVPPEKHGDALVAIDKLDKIGRDKVADDMVARGIDRAAADVCLRAFEDLDAFNELVGRSERGAAATRNVAEIITLVESGPGKGHVRVHAAPRARPLVLHRRDHGDCRRRDRQPRRRRPLRRTDWHVLRRTDSRPAASRSASSGSSSS